MEPSFETVAALMAVAFFAGGIDAIAGGGGLITIPALLAAGLPPVSALATNKLQSTFGTGGAVWAYARQGHVDFRRFSGPAAAAFAGSAIGAFSLTQIDPAFLSGLIPVLLVAIAVYYLAAPKMDEEDQHSRAPPALLLAAALLIGAYDGFFGPGTGSFFTTVLVAVFGLGLVRAVAHTKLLNFSSNLAALAVLAPGGRVYWATGLAMAAASVAGGQIGAHIALRFRAGVVRPLLVVICLALTARLLSRPNNPIVALVRGWLE